MSDVTREVVGAAFRPNGSLMTLYVREDGIQITQYDADWSDYEQHWLFKDSGSDISIDGCTSTYWVTPTISDARVHADRPQRRLPRLTPEWTPEILLVELQDGETDDIVYCGVCRDHRSDDRLCEHVWWCPGLGWWTGPGIDSSDRCEHDLGKRACEDSDE